MKKTIFALLFTVLFPFICHAQGSLCEQTGKSYIGAIQPVLIRGHASNTGTTQNPLWDSGGGTSYVQLTTGTALEAVSSSANDTSAGTGARTIRVCGVDGNYAEFCETVTMNGTTAVALANTSVIGINSVDTLTAGSTLTNAGAVAIRTVSGSVNKTRMGSDQYGFGRTSDFIYTVPANKTLILKKITLGATAIVGDLSFTLYSFTSTGIKKVEALHKISQTNTAFADGQGVMDFGTGLLIPEKTLIILMGTTSTGSAYTSAIGTAELRDNTLCPNGYF